MNEKLIEEGIKYLFDPEEKQVTLGASVLLLICAISLHITNTKLFIKHLFSKRKE